MGFTGNWATQKFEHGNILSIDMRTLKADPNNDKQQNITATNLSEIDKFKVFSFSNGKPDSQMILG